MVVARKKRLSRCWISWLGNENKKSKKTTLRHEKRCGKDLEVIFVPEIYEEICRKLGFELADYVPPVSDTEDDTHENPFLKLTTEEIIFLYKNGYLDN